MMKHSCGARAAHQIFLDEEHMGGNADVAPGVQGGLGNAISGLLAGCAQQEPPTGLREASPAGVTSLLQVRSHGLAAHFG